MSYKTWITGVLLFCLLPTAVFAETADFLFPKVKGVHRSLICTGSDSECKTMFLIQGKNFLNSNGSQGVHVGGQWAEILRWENDMVVATAPKALLEKTPSVTVDTTLHRPILTIADETIVSMFEQSVDVALESIKVHDDGTRYIAAGPKYTDPDRTYYRDSYWASGMVLMIEPYVVRDQILLLARGVESNGSVPSAIPVDEDDARIPLWLEHHDAGLYFVMMVYDYVRWTGDTSILSEVVGGRDILTTMEDVVSFLSTRDTDNNYLPEKNGNPLQDWLDSIPRPGEVLYNQVLYYRALRNLVELTQIVGEMKHAQAFHRQSMLVRYMINKQFWNDEKGYYYESCEDGVCVDRLTNESSLAILYDVIDPSNRERLFSSLRKLETKENTAVAYGDWGVLNAWPLYDGFTPYDYHNGTDWPFLDGMNAGARLKFDNDDWYYPLTRWWSYNQEHWPDRVLPEYVSPVDQDAGEWQAWSVNPMVSFVRYGIGLDPNLNGAYSVSSSVVGDFSLEDVYVRGDRLTIQTTE